MFVYDSYRRYKLDISEHKIFDPIRKKYVALTPEEKIRQQTIKYLIRRLKVPDDRIGIELSLTRLGDFGNKKRADICIFDEDNNVIAVIECKSYYIGTSEMPYVQALDYVTSINVHNYFVVDGWEMNGFHYSKSKQQFEPFTQLPSYDELLLLR